jgi:phenylacetate-coenzyme A ligase PaaK-like adenylate-forming protein
LKRRFAKISGMDREAVDAIQTRHIQDTLEHAVAASRFYRDYYRSGSGGDVSKGPFSALPLLDKPRMMDHLDDVFTTPVLKRDALEQHLASSPVGARYLGQYPVVHTSGSSGRIGIFAYDPVGWDTLKALVLARCTSFGIGLRRKRLAYIGLTDGHYAGVTLASDVPRSMAAYTDVSVNEPIARVVDQLNAFQPDDLRGYPSGLFILASEQQAGRLNIQPRRVVSSAEPLDAKTAQLIEEVYGVAPYNFYAASESIGIAQDCDLHCGLHVFNDLYALELLDNDGEPVSAGRPGKVVLTNLYNRCQPLIRYEMQDEAVYAEDTCDCGLPFPLLTNVYGRQEEIVWVENGRGGVDMLHPMVFVEFFVPSLRRLQVHYDARNKIRLLVVSEDHADSVVPAVTRRMNAILAGKHLQDVVDFEVVTVDSIPHDPKTGKTKTVIASVGPPKNV